MVRNAILWDHLVNLQQFLKKIFATPIRRFRREVGRTGGRVSKENRSYFVLLAALWRNGIRGETLQSGTKRPPSNRSRRIRSTSAVVPARMFEICSVDGNARVEWLDRLRRVERSRRLDCRGRTRQERRFAVGFASRNSERRLCTGRGAAAFSGRSDPAPDAGREDRQTGKRGAERRFENSEEVGRRRATFTSVPASFAKVALAARRSRFAANPLVRDRAFFWSPKFTCECGKADSWTDRRHTGPNDGEKRPPRRCLLSNWRYRPLPPRNTPSTRNGSSIHSLLNLAESRVWLRQSVPVLHCPKTIDCPGVRSSNGIQNTISSSASRSRTDPPFKS